MTISAYAFLTDSSRQAGLRRSGSEVIVVGGVLRSNFREVDGEGGYLGELPSQDDPWFHLSSIRYCNEMWMRTRNGKGRSQGG